MADPLAGFIPDTVKNDEPAREAVLKLAKVVTDRPEVLLGKGITGVLGHCIACHR